MPRAMFQADRYHLTQLNFSLTESAIFPDGNKLSDKSATFYSAFRKLPFAPCVGHRRLEEYLTHMSIDPARIRFLHNDRAGLNLAADYLANKKIKAVVRAVRPGTIIFPNEPFADITGDFGMIQFMEVKFEHAFDIPMTVASRALEMRLVAGDRWLSDFSLRRNGEIERAVDVAEFAYIGGFNDTSNMEAGFLLDQVPVGTMAHYLVQSYRNVKEADSKTGRDKHFEQTCFEHWLDAHPNGTTLLLDTISVSSGIKHAIAAAKSSSERQKALKAVRIDTKPLDKWSVYVQQMLDANGMSDVKILTSGDHDKDSIAAVVRAHPRAFGFGVGTKILAEVETVAGVIFKECLIDGVPTLKCSSRAKATLPGKLQVWRFIDHGGFYLGDIIAPQGDYTFFYECPWDDYASVIPLLEDFWVDGRTNYTVPTMQEQRAVVMNEIKKFRDPYHYPVILAPELKKMVDNIAEDMNKDENEYPDVVVLDSDVIEGA